MSTHEQERPPSDRASFDIPDLGELQLPDDFGSDLPPDGGQTYSRAAMPKPPTPTEPDDPADGGRSPLETSAETVDRPGAMESDGGASSADSSPEGTVWTVRFPSIDDSIDAPGQHATSSPRASFPLPDPVSSLPYDSTQSPTATGPAAQSSPTYALHRLVGRGGMGEVWLATQESLKRPVAVKMIARESWDMLAHNPRERDQAVREFQQEAFAAAWLDHPNIVPVHDLGKGAPGSPPMLAMKMVSGESWSSILQRDLIQLNDAEIFAKHLPILVDVCQAVAFAHARGIIHRDLKPSQVMVGAFGETLLMDWGLAVRFGSGLAAAGASSTGSLPEEIPSLDTATNPAGTPVMMAPEQTTSGTRLLGPWTDIYLLGGTLYYLLTGKFPHSHSNSLEAMKKAMVGIVEPPQEAARHRQVPRALADLAMHALAKRPRDRPRQVVDFLNELNAYLSGSSRRQESEELTRQAAESFEELERASDPPHRHAQTDGAKETYRLHASVAEKLARALQQWPENETARTLRARNLATRLKTEMRNGDLILAESHLADLQELDASDTKSIDVPAMEKLLARAISKRAKARRWMIGLSSVAALFLIGIVFVLSFQFYAMARVESTITAAAEEADGHATARLADGLTAAVEQAASLQLTSGTQLSTADETELAHRVRVAVANQLGEFFETIDYEHWPTRTLVSGVPGPLQRFEFKMRTKTREEIVNELIHASGLMRNGGEE